jgi:hypothetical protein
VQKFNLPGVKTYSLPFLLINLVLVLTLKSLVLGGAGNGCNFCGIYSDANAEGHVSISCRCFLS